MSCSSVDELKLIYSILMVLCLAFVLGFIIGIGLMFRKNDAPDGFGPLGKNSAATLMFLLLCLIIALLVFLPAANDVLDRSEQLSQYPPWKNNCPDYWVRNGAVCQNKENLPVTTETVNGVTYSPSTKTLTPADSNNNCKWADENDIPWTGCCGAGVCQSVSEDN